jgi:hypothetical protein
MKDFCQKILIPERSMHLNNQPNTNNAVDNGFNKKIGKSCYRVLVYSSPTSREDFSDKLLRIIKNEAAEKAVTS